MATNPSNVVMTVGRIFLCGNGFSLQIKTCCVTTTYVRM